ncbi:hypothetical protein RHMOL_Rhmol11G0137500 [Rhododendron molle]|uniref:Uncharacterized protein n=1 Tax=Rhododendron molle TaxID=49168 RepID=A0ACC0LS74_RHOML|nr:hypothetical protein RHMOL_Rhmol11G0137500 [Rhododendron molle]
MVKLLVLLSPSEFCWVLRSVPNGLGGHAAVLMDGVVRPPYHCGVVWFLLNGCDASAAVGGSDGSVYFHGFTAGGVVERGGRDRFGWWLLFVTACGGGRGDWECTDE